MRRTHTKAQSIHFWINIDGTQCQNFKASISATINQRQKVPHRDQPHLRDYRTICEIRLPSTPRTRHLIKLTRNTMKVTSPTSVVDGILRFRVSDISCSMGRFRDFRGTPECVVCGFCLCMNSGSPFERTGSWSGFLKCWNAILLILKLCGPSEIE